MRESILVIVMSTEVLEEAKEAFGLFDQDSAGSIRTKDLGLVLRSLGFNISTLELKKMEQDADPDELGFVKMTPFLRQLNTAVELSTASNMNAKVALKKLGTSAATLLGEKDPEQISIHNLKHLLTRMGDKMSSEEFSELCRDIETENGHIKIDTLVSFFIVCII